MYTGVHIRLARRNHLLHLLLLLALMLPALAIQPVQPVSLNAHPSLLALSVEQPENRVPVIIQKTVADSSIEATVVRHGGTLLGDFSFIRAFAAEVPAKEIPLLARLSGVRWISPDAPVEKQDCDCAISTSNLASVYLQSIGATKVWNAPTYLQGQGIAVAVLDSGIGTGTGDFSDKSNGRPSRILATVKTNTTSQYSDDKYGHGTHVSGIIASNGTTSNGAYMGVAPQTNLITVKVTNDSGMATVMDVLYGFQWIYFNKDKYNIRVINLSLNSTVAQSYNVDPLDAAVEFLWFNKIVVVASSGNNGTTTPGGVYAPANDPFIITVGAVDDRGTAAPGDDIVAPFSAYGTTLDGFAKPDLVAPGINIISDLAGSSVVLATQHPDHLVNTPTGSYFRMSGTSMSAAITSGAVALLLQSNPNLTPDQVKQRLKSTATRLGNMQGAGSGELNIYAAVTSTSTASANNGITLSWLLWNGTQPVVWDSANWSNANWSSANWSSANWSSANWSSANWSSANWSSDYWSSDYWGP